MISTGAQENHNGLLINRTAVRAFILETIRNFRPTWGATRVSEGAIRQIDELLRQHIAEYVRHHPSRGKTFNQVF